MDQFLTAETNKNAAIVVKLLHHLGHGYTAWMDNFYNPTEMAHVCPPPFHARPHARPHTEAFELKALIGTQEVSDIYIPQR